jgi:hypothetical protein
MPSPMRKPFMLALTALLMLTAAFAQVVCDSTTNIDNNGNWCTNLTAPASKDYNPAGPVFTPVREDGHAPPVGFPGSVSFVNGPNTAQVGLPFDPLKLHGVVKAEGANDSVLNGRFTLSTVNGPRLANCHGFQWYKNTYKLIDLESTQKPSGYDYWWNGSFSVKYTGAPHHYRGGCSANYTPGISTTEISATLIP